MEKKQAMAILQLSSQATRQDAKTAFRRLAKLHHPDHFAQDAGAVIQAEKQMKSINQAYHLLKSLLPQGAEKTSPVRDMPQKMRSPGFADLVKRMKKNFWKKADPARPAGRTGIFEGTATAGQAGAGRAAGSARTGTGSGSSGCSRPHGAPESSRPHGRRSAESSRPAGPGTSFEQVFKPLFSGTCPGAAPEQGAGQGTGPGYRQGQGQAAGPAFGKKTGPGYRQKAGPRAGTGCTHGTGAGSGTEKPSAGRIHSPYDGFVRYMALKNRIQARTRLQDQNNSARVEKISRIRPVGRVTRD